MRYIVRGIINGSKQTLKEMGLPKDLKIDQVWTILHEDEDMLVAPLRHCHNAFMEDVGHDWMLWKGIFKYHPHSSNIGDKCDLIIIAEN